MSKIMGITRAAVSSIVDDLIDLGIVREVEGHYPSGRKPIVLEICSDKGYVLGIDMGATHIQILLADFSGKVVGDTERPFRVADGPKICLDLVETLVIDLLNEHSIGMEKIMAAGLGVPGPVLQKYGEVSAPPIMPGWDGYPIRTDLQKRFHCPISVNNDAEMGALGEWAYGSGRGEKNLVYIKVGTGIGAGLFLNGQIYSGFSGSSGEIGHITINENGPLCSCGNHGCLEAFAGGNAIARQALTAVNKGIRTQLSEIQPSSGITARDVIHAARSGDHLAQQLMQEAGVHLGTAIAGLVNLLNPDIIIIGGGVAQMGDLLIEPIRRTINQRSLQISTRGLRITTALLERRSSGMGAVVQALSLILHSIAEKSIIN
ncbi:MAG: ROK family protein [Anaerolineaceae bacterium]|nr:ROK family protein [Anaerolineaceae bacterium]